MKKLSILLIVILSSCSPTTVTKKDFERAEGFCRDNGGLKQLVTEDTKASVTCECVDGVKLQFVLETYKHINANY